MKFFSPMRNKVIVEIIELVEINIKLIKKLSITIAENIVTIPWQGRANIITKNISRKIIKYTSKIFLVLRICSLCYKRESKFPNMPVFIKKK